ncbi:MAG TPA: hypothetical protein VGC90_00230 [Candidatus Limnocylindrales bacterium]
MIGLGIVVIAAVIYWLSDHNFDAGRGDFFYLADAFLHGRTWLDFRPGPYDVIDVGGRYYVPFAPFPALALAPLVAVVGAVQADVLEPVVNAVLAAGAVGLAWMLLGRVGVRRWTDRTWLMVLFGFSTPLWWVTTRGGVWHTGQIVATILTLGCLLELFGRRRALVIGLLAGAAFLTRAPLAFAIPFYALLLDPGLASDPRGADARPSHTRAGSPSRWPSAVRAWALLAAGVVPALAFFLWYNAVRFGSPLESGYGLAALPEWLEAQRQQGLFSLAHVGMNIDYLFLHMPTQIPDAPFFKPDGLGMSVFLTSPALLLAAFADWRSRTSWLLLGAAAAVLVPTLLYYGGGWLQYSYRYFLDSIPFLFVLAGFAAARAGRIGWPWRVLIAFGVVVNLGGVYWTDKF